MVSIVSDTKFEFGAAHLDITFVTNGSNSYQVDYTGNLREGDGAGGYTDHAITGGTCDKGTLLVTVNVDGNDVTVFVKNTTVLAATTIAAPARGGEREVIVYTLTRGEFARVTLSQAVGRE